MNNYSKQREIVLETLKNTSIHPTAEQLYEMIHQNNPTISKSTVYRNINILLENKIIRKVKMPTGANRFDYIGEEHYHAICEKCGKVFDFEYCFEKKNLKKTIQNQTGIITNVDSITVYGICEKCKSKIKNEEDFKYGIKRI
ncbi:MAG: transcriptional repressor [Clostridia bacterium]